MKCTYSKQNIILRTDNGNVHAKIKAEKQNRQTEKAKDAVPYNNNEQLNKHNNLLRKGLNKMSL